MTVIECLLGGLHESSRVDAIRALVAGDLQPIRYQAASACLFDLSLYPKIPTKP